MLALTRRTGEEIIIGDPANPVGIIRVVDIHGDKVRLAFDFPRDMQINRKELADQKLQQEAGDTPEAPAGKAEEKQPESNENANPLAMEGGQKGQHKRSGSRGNRPANRRRDRRDRR